MSNRSLSLILCAFVCAMGTELVAAPVEYVKICDTYGAGFLYIPGMEICHQPLTGDTRQTTENGVWRSRLPYPTGRWVRRTARECANGRTVSIGTFQSTDFTLNLWNRKQTAPVPLALDDGEYVSKVMMRGGFYDPRRPGNRSGVHGATVFCLRSLDPSVPEEVPEVTNPEDPPAKPRWGNGMLPLGCIPNSRILNVPATYVIDADAIHPGYDFGFANEEQTEDYGPFEHDSHVAVTTDFGTGGANLLTYHDATDDTDKPLAGSITVSVCVASAPGPFSP
jgi:hypothetical protein